MADIRAAAGEKVSKQQKAVDRLLLTLEQSWEVPVDGVVDHTHNLMRRGKTPTVQEIVHVKADAEDCKKPLTAKPAVGGVKVPQALGGKLLQYPAKVHYRLVYKEVGKTIDQLDSMQDVFKCLYEIVKGLYHMHAAGYVHRDISAGNILVVGGKAKLGDVEYAKEEHDDSGHEVRTGTAFFMATEVAEHDYTHMMTRKQLREHVDLELLDEDSDDSDATPSDHEDDVLPMLAAADESKPAADSTRLNTIIEEESSPHDQDAESQPHDVVEEKPEPVFKYNPLHDLESVWWVAVYMWLCSYPANNDPGMDETTWNERLKAHARLAARVFREDSYRKRFFAVERTLTRTLGSLLPSFEAIGRHLEGIRETIMAAYRDAEQDPSAIDFQVAKYAYTDILMSLSAVRKSLAGKKDIKLVFTDTRAMDEYLASLEKKTTQLATTDAANERSYDNATNDGTHRSKILRTSGTVPLGAALSSRRS
ncbi:hypothetical protein PHLGIDRAFT_38259 [Phlebiopsis gigantea 11061_1 CR5-6]|uniref:Protein kinase domain-containing protein n=1 Tax=Phlebiopsis gigantea (strain 11061_1 CR5-6) TaxID=745531 RepID=A0A0C3NAN5_PHLG1|nr:hypothetical protein PHLGIDRAFT_38259 [Phlebiopsis gigantea 11061_1 CR5-6]